MAEAQVRYFAAAADASGLTEETLTVPNAAGGRATLGSLRELLDERYGPAMQMVLASGSFLVDGTVRRDSAFALPVGDSPTRIDILPPFAGG